MITKKKTLKSLTSCLLAIGIILSFTLQSALAAAWGKKEPPQFEDFPSKQIHASKLSEVDFSTNKWARTYKTRIREGYKSGVNFAGHYTIVTWGCGSICQNSVAIDALTGKIYSMPSSGKGLYYKVTSKLLIVDPPDPPDDSTDYSPSDSPLNSMPTSYYIWDKNRLHLLLVEENTVKDDRLGE